MYALYVIVVYNIFMYAFNLLVFVVVYSFPTYVWL
jgi:hypothetical protein